MSASYQISVDPDRRLLSLALTGFFTAGDAQEFVEDVRAAVTGLGRLPNTHLTLCDVSACKLQLQDVVAVFGGHIRDPRYRARRLAFVVGGSVAVVQVRRLLNRVDTAYFDNRAAAERWLDEPQAAAA